MKIQAVVELMNTEKEALALNDAREVDVEMLEDHDNKSDNTSVAGDKDSSQRKVGREETTRRLVHPLVTGNNLSMNMQKRNKLEAFIPTSSVKRTRKKSALFDDSLEMVENAVFEDEYDENNSVPRRSLQFSTDLNL